RLCNERPVAGSAARDELPLQRLTGAHVDALCLLEMQRRVLHAQLVTAGCDIEDAGVVPQLAIVQVHGDPAAGRGDLQTRGPRAGVAGAMVSGAIVAGAPALSTARSAGAAAATSVASVAAGASRPATTCAASQGASAFATSAAEAKRSRASDASSRRATAASA